MTLRDWIAAEGLSREEAAARFGITRRGLEPLITRFKSPGFALAQRIIEVSGGKITVHELTRLHRSTPQRIGAAAA